MKEPRHEHGNPRRQFLRKLAAGAAATIALPAWGSSELGFRALPAIASPAEEAYWEQVSQQFAVPSNLIMANAANLCPSPTSVNDKVNATLKELGKDVSFQFRARFADKRQKSLEALASFLGVDKAEVGITRNTSESNNIIVNGLDLKRGDDVLIWDQNHYSNAIAWEERAKRYGFTVRRFTLPADPSSNEEILELVGKSISPATRVLAFSHISNVSGLAMPAARLCKLAREKNILTLVDGAQSFGMMDLNLHELDCDFYSASTHKWLMGPLENGVLYVRAEAIPKVWPQVISAGWKSTGLTVDEKLCVLGQRNETTPFALPEAIAFQQAIGKKNIETRVRELNRYLVENIRKIPGATIVSPSRAEFTAGITVVSLAGKKSQDVYQKLYDQYGIACASTGGIRLSPHVYNTMAHMDRIVTALKSLAA